MSLRYGSVCSGIEAATVAWHPLGWQPQFFSEIEAAPRAVLKHRWPEVPLHGDFTTIREGEYGAIDLLVGGTPCQSFSVAGLRGGLADDRGNLALQYLRLAQRLRPRWLVWENVPGVLSSSGGRDFGAILGGMVELGYGFAYRVLDAQYVRVDGFGRAVPQRRRRVFVVGYLGDWRRPAAVLLERACLRGDPAPRRGAGAGAAAGVAAGLGGGRGDTGRKEAGRSAAQAFGGGQNCNPTDVSTALMGHPGGRYSLDTETFIAEPVCGTLAAGAHPGSYNGQDAYTGHLIASAFDARPSDVIQYGPITGPLDTDGQTIGVLIDADAAQARSDQALRALRGAVGAEAFATWGAGVVSTLRAQEVLRSGVHGESLRRPTDKRNGVGHDASPLQEVGGAGPVRALWEAGCVGRPPQGWQPPERLARELGAHLSELSQPGASAERFLLGLWRAGEGLGLLREALSALQATRRPADHQGQPAHTRWSVRRLTPLEAERLQGFPDGWTAVPWRSGTMPDGPRYKMLGNSMAVNVMRWIGRRIEAVDALEAAPALMAAE